MTNGSDSRLRLEIIGGFRAILDGRQIPADTWPSRRSAELVQLLSLSEGHSLTRDQVMESLWPHLEADAAAANLRKAAHHARRALACPEAVMLRRGMVALLPGGQVGTDFHEFQVSAREALAVGDVDRAREVVERFGGELLPSALYQEWAQPARRHLQALRRELMKAGRLWADLIALEPLDETGYREAMREAIESGNRALAIQWYGRLRTVLAAELSAVPSGEVETLYRLCVADLGLRPPTLVGRDIHLATAASAMQSAGDSGLRCLAIRGEAGIGKTRLAHELASVAANEGWTHLHVSCAATGPPYQPLVRAVEQMIAKGPRASVPDHALRTFAVLSGDDLPADEQIGRHKVMGALEAVLEGAVGNGQALIVFDDAHFADEATIDVLLHLLAGESSTLVFIVLTYETGSAPISLMKGLSRFNRSGRSIEIVLEPLGLDEAAAVVRLASNAELPDATLVQILELSQGNPSLALELARSVDVEGALRVMPSVWEAATAWSHEMDEGSVALLERFAVAGADLTTDDILTVTGMDEPDAHRLLDHAMKIGVLDVADGRYQFTRELVRRALCRRVPPHRQAAIHRDLARRLAAGGTAVPQRVAHHWIEGGRPAEARPWLLAAARRAIGVGAFGESLRAAETVLASEDSNSEALVLRADSLAATGRPDAIAAYARAVQHVGEDEARDLKAKLALTQLKSGDPGGALQTLDSVTPASMTGRISEALTLSGAAAIGYGDAAVAAEKAAQARGLALEAGDSGAVVEASWALSLAAHARGDLQSNLRADLALSAGREQLAIRIFDGHLCATERLLYGSHPYDQVIEFAESLRAESQRMDALRGQGFALTLSGEARLLAGRLQEAIADLEEAVDLNRSIGATAGEALALQRRAEADRYLGKSETAHAFLTRALSVARDSYLGHHLFDRIYGALISVAEDDDHRLARIEEAEQAVAGPAETCPACRITLEVPAAIAAAQAHDITRARRHADAVDMLSQIMVPQPGWRAAADEVHGYLARAMDDNVTATSRFRRAAELYRAAGQPLDTSRCEKLSRT